MNKLIKYILISILIVFNLFIIYNILFIDYYHQDINYLCPGVKFSVNYIEKNPDYCLFEGDESIFRVVLINDGTEKISSVTFNTISESAEVYNEVLNDSIDIGEKKEISIPLNLGGDKLSRVRITPIINNNSEDILCIDRSLYLFSVPLCNMTTN